MTQYWKPPERIAAKKRGKWRTQQNAKAIPKRRIKKGKA
jgi:hypothetical protein